MPEKALEEIKERLSKAKEEGKEYFGSITFHVANNKFVSVETDFKIEEKKKKILT